MTATDLQPDLLACPRCDKTPLARKDDSYRCAGCKTLYPVVNGIPWLFAEPDAALGTWRGRLHFALQQLASDSQKISSELKAKDLHELTRERLEQQGRAVDEHRNMLRQILAPLDIQSMQASYESYLAMRTRLPTDQGIHTYFANIHRDWCWGDTENEASLEQIKAVVPADEKLGNTLVLGSGASRLAYDVHMRMNSSLTIAADFNPLLLLIAANVVKGETVSLYEFPLAPKTADDYAVLRELSAPEPVREGFHFAFCDALRPPFAESRFDTIVTPWLIDVINEDLPLLAARINHLLNDGGRWINFGSLAFDHPLRARCYSPAETLAIIEEAGFAKPIVAEASIPYMCSPASRHARQETVFTFAAHKEKPAGKPERYKALPDWLVTGKEAVPLTSSFHKQALSTQIHSYIMSLIDGKRTIEDMAGILEQQKLMTKEEAIPAVRNFLTRMYDDSQRSSGF